MPDDERGELLQLAHETLKLLDMYQRAHTLALRYAVPDLNRQIELVRALALSASIPPTVIPFPEVQ